MDLSNVLTQIALTITPRQ